MESQLTFRKGLKDGLPVCLGYIPVAFAFSIRAIVLGVPAWGAILTSLTNLTSAGQYAGTELIAEHCAYLEIGITVFIINLRYMLMSLAISQKLDGNIPTWKRMIFSFGITDETFVIASIQKGKITAAYMFGLILLPIAGWNLGTVLGAVASQLLPGSLQNALGMALFAMFIAILVPPAKRDHKLFCIVMIAITISCMMYYFSFLSFISSGMRIILAAVIAAAVGAWLFPREEEE